MDKLLQNNLEEATTDLGFCKTTNTKLIQNQEINTFIIQLLIENG